MGAGLQDTIGLQDNIYTATLDINKHETENPKKAKGNGIKQTMLVAHIHPITPTYIHKLVERIWTLLIITIRNSK